MSARAERFPLFDGLRALAALSVLVFHAVVATPLYHTSSLGPLRFAAHLDVGVRVFFVISGFLLYRPFALAHLAGRPAPSTGAYAWRRLLRIGPGYWAALALVTLTLSTGGVWTLARVWLYLGLAQGYAPGRTLAAMPQAWTLTVEVAFYALLPLVAALVRRGRSAELGARARREWTGIAILVAVSVTWKAVLLVAGPGNAADSVAELALPTYLDTFAVGMAFAVLSARAALAERPAPLLTACARRPGATWLLALGAFVLASLLGYPGLSDPLGFLARHVLYGLVAAALVAPVVAAREPGGALRALALRPVAFLGLVSYGIYLYHVWVLDRIYVWIGLPRSYAALLALAGLGVLGATAVAALSYVALERPAVRLKGRVGAPRASEDQPGAVSAPALGAAPPG